MVVTRKKFLQYKFTVIDASAETAADTRDPIVRALKYRFLPMRIHKSNPELLEQLIFASQDNEAEFEYQP